MPTIDQNPSLAEAPLEYASPDSLAVAAGLIGVLWTILSCALAADVLLWVAFYNGYPTIFSDTGSYLLTGAFHVAFAPFRAPGYSAFVRLTSLGKSPWFTVAAQALLVVYVLRETCNQLIGGSRKFINLCLLAAVCGLVALTSLPWLVSLLMPDVFAGLAFLCIFLLAFACELPRVKRILLASILTISVAAHTSLFPITGLFILAIIILRFVARRSYELPPASSVLAWLLVPILAAGFWTASQNREMGLGFRLSPSGNAFLLGRLFGDGLAADFLHENCPKNHFISCRYLSDLPRTEGEFLFWHPLYRDLLKGNPREIDTIVRGTLRAYPRKFILNSAKQTLLQLASLRTGDELRTYAAHDWNNEAMLRVFPADLQRLENSRQFRGRMLSMPDTVSPFHTAIFWLSFVASLAFARTARFTRLNKFLASAILFLVINAAVCGALAGVYDRYQSRVAWIIPFCLITYFCNLIAERRRSVARQNSPALASLELI